jgi:hypothetical protein
MTVATGLRATTEVVSQALRQVVSRGAAGAMTAALKAIALETVK